MNGISDWSPLSGDPGCDETLEEWGKAMIAQLDKMSPFRALQAMEDMTDQERDILREFIAKDWRTS
jgi:hypothetical protein